MTKINIKVVLKRLEFRVRFSVQKAKPDILSCFLLFSTPPIVPEMLFLQMDLQALEQKEGTPREAPGTHSRFGKRKICPPASTSSLLSR